MTGFSDRLAAAVQQTGVGACIGLDPHLDRLPEPLVASHGPAEAAKQFCLGVIDVVAGHVPTSPIVTDVNHSCCAQGS